VRKGISIDIGRKGMNLRPVGPLVRMAAVIFGGVATLNLASTVTIKLLRFASEKKRVSMSFSSWLYPILSSKLM